MHFPATLALVGLIGLQSPSVNAQSYLSACIFGPKTPTSSILTGSAFVATNVTVANESTDTSCFINFTTAATGNLGIKTNANLTLDSSTGIVTFASSVLTTTDINGGTVDGTVIGGASAAAGTFTDLTSTGTTTVGNSAADTLVLNAGLITLNSDFVATRALGALVSGDTVGPSFEFSLSGHVDGTSGYSAIGTSIASTGANDVSYILANYSFSTHNGSGTLDIANGLEAGVRAISTGHINTGVAFQLDHPILSGSGGIGTTIGVNIDNQGDATKVTNAVGLNINDFTGSVTSTRGIQSAFSSGTGKNFIYHSGTASSVHTGSVRIGSTVAPTVALDVTGASLISTTLGVTGQVSGGNFVPTTTTVPTNGLYLPAANTLGFAINSAAEMQLTSTALSPMADGGSSLGTTALGWQNLFGNTGFVFNLENGNWVATHTSGILTVGTGDLRVTTAGTNSASVVTVGGTQTLTGKSISVGQITGLNLTGPITSVGLATTIVAPTYPLMSYGGKSFNGTTDYLDSNALTGIADGKKGTWVCKFRFANAASASEVLQTNTGNQFAVSRTSTGNLQFLAENSAGTGILSQTTSGTPCAAAGTYLVEASWDMATAGSMRIYINDVAASITSTTFTNDTIDYTVAENSVGAGVTGLNLFAGDIYYLYFNATTNIEFNTEANRRLFGDSNNVPVYMGANGELPTGSSPILFLAYDTVARWKNNRGTATSTFTENGTPAEVTTALNGQYAPIVSQWKAWTPTRTGWTDVGAPTVTANYMESGNVAFLEVKVVPSTTVATVAGTSYINLPITAAGLAGGGSMEDATTFVSIGACVIDVANSRCYVPTKTATGDTLLIEARWRI